MSTTVLMGLFSLLEKVANKALEFDPGTRIGLANLAGKTLSLAINKTGIKAYVHFTQEQLQLLHHFEGEVTAEVSGSPLALFNTLITPTTSFYNSDVEVSGNLGFLTEIQKLMQSLDIDWEDALSQYTGVLPAHAIAEAGRNFSAWKTERQDNLPRLIREYLTEELEALVSPQELQLFYNDVDNLQLALDRLEAHVNQYELRLMHTGKEQG